MICLFESTLSDGHIAASQEMALSVGGRNLQLLAMVHSCGVGRRISPHCF